MHERTQQCAAFAAALRVLAVDPPARPNVVWLMLDDLGWGEVGAFPADSPHGRIATPELDKFAAQGVRFTHARVGRRLVYIVWDVDSREGELVWAAAAAAAAAREETSVSKGSR